MQKTRPLFGVISMLPLNATSKARRGMIWSDVNGDGLPDLLVAEPESGQLTVFIQGKSGRMAAGKVYSTLTGVSEIQVNDWDGTGRAKVFLLSGDERAVAVTQFDGQGRVRVSHRAAVRRQAVDDGTGIPKPGAKPMLAVILDQDGKRVLVTRTASGETKSHKLSESFKSTPSSMAWHDIDQDGLNDLVLLTRTKKSKFFSRLPKASTKSMFRRRAAACWNSLGWRARTWMATGKSNSCCRMPLTESRASFKRSAARRASADPACGWVACEFAA